MQRIGLRRLVVGFWAAACVVLLVGCGAMRPYSVRNLGEDGGGGGSAGRFTVTIEPDVLAFFTAGSMNFRVFITSVGGWSGTVSLNVQNVPANCFATLAVDQVVLPAGQTLIVSGSMLWKGLPPTGVFQYMAVGNGGGLTASDTALCNLSRGPD